MGTTSDVGVCVLCGGAGFDLKICPQCGHQGRPEDVRPSGTRESCTCVSCIECCHRVPGWLLPGEAEKIAAFLKISVEQLFHESLAIDWWYGDPDTFVLLPNVVGHAPGRELPSSRRGTCVFLKDDRCSIHDVKPYECRSALHGEYSSVREPIADAWRHEQQQIEALLGRRPSAYDV